MKKLLLPAIAMLSLSVTTYAQQNLGVATSNWSTVNSMYLNPANIAGSNEKVTISIFSLNAGLDNNLGSISTVGGVSNNIKDGNTNIFNYSSSSSAFSMLAPVVDVRGPGAIVSINNKHSIAITTGIRGFNQLNNFDRSLYNTINDPSSVSTGNVDLTSKNFNYTAQLWTEVGISYGVVLLDQGESELRAGATLRYLGGIGYLGLKGNNLDAHYRAGVDSFYVSKSDMQFASNIVSTNDAINNGLSNNNLLSEFFGKKNGMGMGADLGVVYDYKPEAEGYAHSGRNNYKVRISAAVTDLGSIKYKSDVNFNANVTGNGYLTGQGLADNVRNFDDFRAYAKRQGFTADTSRAATKLYMPTALHLSADYNISNNFFVNALYIGNLVNRQNFGNSYYNQVTITPRYDKRAYTVALPITYSMLTNGLKMGIGLRYSGFFVGSDDMLALFAKNQYGFNLYVGGCVPIYRKSNVHGRYYHERDTADEQPELDMEHGGAKDTTDNCPDLVAMSYDSPTTEPALTNQGHTTDTDGDGIPDDEDACPTVAGPASHHGCPLPEDAPKKTANFSTTTIYTGKGRSAIDKESSKTLDQLAVILKEYPRQKIVMYSYTDNSVLAKSLTISWARVASVKKYLVGKGISADRIETHALGAANPVASNDTEEGKAKNRRIVINLVKK